MWKTIINLLFPIHCLGCKREGNFICPSCFEKIEINKKLYFDKTDTLKKIFIAGNHKDKLLKQAIYKYKYNFIKDLAKPLGQLMINQLTKSLQKNQLKKLLLIPIPLHSKRLRWRGFNQSELLANEISQKLNIPMINNFLIRTKHTLPQVKIQKASQRRQNIHDVFELKGRALRATSLMLEGQKGVLERHGLEKSNIDLKNKTLLLIDDVSTTKATLKEAARVLNTLKPKQIWGLVLTKG